ncbi:MAG TPA: ATP-dependent metallopeptidase FtsH/Yme1/Tma family protein, partial [Acidimicrobiales bacterium]|nr:ATP-dependent metallopeptidase FtsH/Yme1/Tma family protein [Acidimicrobiales bacterium]
MTKQANPPPRGDKPTPTAPPPPPPWRHWLWLIALVLFVGLFFVLPSTRVTPSVTLTYSQFVKDVAAKHVKTITITSSGSASGILK